MAIGGEYGGAATFVAEHAADNRRGLATSWIQITATAGFFLCLVVIGACRVFMSEQQFSEWGWRIPFLASIALLVVSVYIRMKLNESPLFQRLKAEGRTSRKPIVESFFTYPNGKYAVLAVLGATAGQGVVWYTGQFYALFFLTITLKVDFLTAYMLIGASLLLAMPFFLVFGRLSDRIGRLRIILVGCALAAASYIPIFQALTHAVNPALEQYQSKVEITVAARGCETHVLVTPKTRYSDCDRVRDLLTKSGLSFESVSGSAGEPVMTTIGSVVVEGWDEAGIREALKATGYPMSADPKRINYWSAIALLTLLVVFVTMVYAPIAAFLVELFPTRVRYTSMSLPYHIGNGWFGGVLPLLSTALAAAYGNIYAGLWYPIAVATATVVIGGLLLRNRRTPAFDS